MTNETQWLKDVCVHQRDSARRLGTDSVGSNMAAGNHVPPASAAPIKPCRRKRQPPPKWWHRLVCCCGPGKKDRPSRRVTYDEDQLQRDLQERGVLYGTQTIDEVSTPFLLYDSHVSRTEGAVIEVAEDAMPRTAVTAHALKS